ncbi:MAG TPA: hypothetical protein QF802_06535, partial [Candidatus Thalassarchaeaceae archaeon]|nr:hypothetical protein [Candidatus Thalassarchaeaceae archaeon]
LKQMEDESENLKSQDDVLARRERWMGALQGAQGQMPETATGKLGGLRGGGRLGQPSAARIGTGLQAAPGSSLKPAGGRLAPARAPIGQKVEPEAIPQQTTTIPRPTADSSLAGRLSPVRPPVKVDAESQKPARSLSDIAQEEIVSQGELGQDADTSPSTLMDIAEKDDWDDDEEDDEKVIEDTSQMLEKISRGPPGGGSLVQTPPQGDAPSRAPSKRGPPGGGRLVRDDESPLELTRPSTEEGEVKKNDVLKPVRRSVLQPKSVETATLQPVKTSTKVLKPTTAPKVAKLTPVKPTLTPVKTAVQEEE